MSEAFSTLFSPIKLGPITLRNRIAMAPLTRQMAEADGTPTDEMAAYYTRRARGGLGLIITEGTYEQDAFQSRAYPVGLTDPKWPLPKQVRARVRPAAGRLRCRFRALHRW